MISLEPENSFQEPSAVLIAKGCQPEGVYLFGNDGHHKVGLQLWEVWSSDTEMYDWFLGHQVFPITHPQPNIQASAVSQNADLGPPGL